MVDVMREFPTFDPSRTTYPMFRLMVEVAHDRGAASRPIRHQLPTDEPIRSPRGEGFGQLEALFEQWSTR